MKFAKSMQRIFAIQRNGHYSRRTKTQTGGHGIFSNSGLGCHLDPIIFFVVSASAYKTDNLPINPAAVRTLENAEGTFNQNQP